MRHGPISSKSIINRGKKSSKFFCVLRKTIQGKRLIRKTYHVYQFLLHHCTGKDMQERIMLFWGPCHLIYQLDTREKAFSLLSSLLNFTFPIFSLIHMDSFLTPLFQVTFKSINAIICQPHK